MKASRNPRPIPLDRDQLVKVTHALGRQAHEKFESEGKPFQGWANSWVLGHYHIDLTDVAGGKHRIGIYLITRPSRGWMDGVTGSFSRSADKIAIEIPVDEARDFDMMRQFTGPSDWGETTFIGTLLHEMTHARDVYSASVPAAQSRMFQNKDRKAYLNQPIEVRARMQELAEIAVRSIPSIKREYSPLRKKIPPMPAVQWVLQEMSYWQEIEPDLTPLSRKKIMLGVERALRDAGLDTSGKGSIPNPVKKLSRTPAYRKAAKAADEASKKAYKTRTAEDHLKALDAHIAAKGKASNPLDDRDHYLSMEQHAYEAEKAAGVVRANPVGSPWTKTTAPDGTIWETYLDEGTSGWQPNDGDMTRQDTGWLHPNLIVTLPGCNNEESLFRGRPSGRQTLQKFSSLVCSIRKQGYLKDKPVQIGVYADGRVCVWEGNHRLRAAIKADAPKVAVWIQYFANSQRQGLIFDPETGIWTGRQTKKNPDTFPRECGCGRIYDEAMWNSLPLETAQGRYPKGVAKFEWGEEVEFRRCPCGSTLTRTLVYGETEPEKNPVRKKSLSQNKRDDMIVLYHGTSSRFMSKIQLDGLVTDDQIYLADTQSEAMGWANDRVGNLRWRKLPAGKPVVLKVIVPASSVRRGLEGIYVHQGSVPSSSIVALVQKRQSRNPSITSNLNLVEVTEGGVAFSTGRPVKIRCIRNTQSSPYFGSTFQQDIEPAGRYLTHLAIDPGAVPPGWEVGEVELKSPLVLSYTTDGPNTPTLYGPGSWKARLHKVFKAKGCDLTKALRKAGYDSIVTVWVTEDGTAHDTREIVLLPEHCENRRRR